MDATHQEAAASTSIGENDGSYRLSVPEGVTSESWAAVGAKPVENEWHIPERNADGEIIGYATRASNGRKGFVKGGHRGLSLKFPLPAYAGSSAENPVFVVEGPSDVAAGLGLGLDVVGKPSATGGAAHLCTLLAGRHVCIIAENDQHAGSKGAGHSAHALSSVAGSVKVIRPPAGVKDLRAWVLAGATRDDVLGAARSAFVLNDLPGFVSPAKEVVAGRNEWEPVPITELGEPEPPDWVWEGYLAVGHISLFTALWKSGKTTLISHLLRDLQRGSGLTSSPLNAPVLVVSEESSRLWKQRREALGLTEAVHILPRPMRSKPSPALWCDFARHVADLVREHGYRLVVFDTLPSLWSVIDENDAAEVGSALQPLHAITEAGAALLLVHHPRKSGGEEATASRGSGALPGFVDVIMEMKRKTPKDIHDRCRVITSHSRFDETPQEVVVELTDTGYRVIGDRATASQAERFDAIESVLPTGQRGASVEEVKAALGPLLPFVGVQTLRDDLKHGAHQGRWKQTGEGKKGDPFRYECLP